MSLDVDVDFDLNLNLNLNLNATFDVAAAVSRAPGSDAGWSLGHALTMEAVDVKVQGGVQVQVQVNVSAS